MKKIYLVLILVFFVGFAIVVFMRRNVTYKGGKKYDLSSPAVNATDAKEFMSEEALKDLKNATEKHTIAKDSGKIGPKINEHFDFGGD